MTRFPILALALLSACAGCQRAPVEPAVQADHTDAIIAALALAGPASLMPRDNAATAGNTWACIGWGTVAVTAPTAAESLALATAGQPLPTFPAVDATLAMCNLPEVDVPEAVVNGVTVVEEYIAQGYQAAMTMITLFAPQLQTSNCRAFAVADAVASWQAVLIPAAVVSPEAWTLAVPAHGIDYSACPVEAVALAPAG